MPRSISVCHSGLFGVEIELTGITREQAANVIATYFGTQVRYLGT